MAKIVCGVRTDRSTVMLINSVGRYCSLGSTLRRF